MDISEPTPDAKRLATRNVCLDTSEYVASRFAFHGQLLARLVALAEAGDVRVFITPVIRREVESNIGEAAQDMSSAVQQLKRKSAMLRDVALPSVKGFFAEYDRDAVIGHLHAQFADFLRSARVTEIPLTGKDAEFVFEAYFGRRAPFGTGKKKSEFPDAFIVASLDGWCADNKEQMYVVTGDGVDQSAPATDGKSAKSVDDADEIKSLTSACRDTSTLLPLSRLSTFLDLITIDEQHEALGIARASATMDWSRLNVATIQSRISDAFMDLDFVPDDFDAELEDVDVGEVKLDTPELVDIDDDRATLAFVAQVRFVVDAHVVDPESGIWDSEDKVMLFQQNRKASYSRTAEIEGEFTLVLPTVEGLSDKMAGEAIAGMMELEDLSISASTVDVSVDPDSADWDSDDAQMEAF